MPADGPLLAAAFALLQGILYAVVGQAVAARPVEGAARRANGFFAMWWFALSGLLVASAALSAAGAFGRMDLAVHLTVLHGLLLAVSLGLWGLGYYFAYLFTGRTGWLVPTGVLYAVCFLGLTYVIQARDPVGIAMGAWGPEIQYTYDPPQGPLMPVLFVLLIGPPLVGALAYLTLFFRVQVPMQKYRIGLVGGGILLWMGSALVAWIVGWSRMEGWRFVSGTVGLLAATAILLAYRPPASVRRRLGGGEAA